MWMTTEPGSAAATRAARVVLPEAPNPSIPTQRVPVRPASAVTTAVTGSIPDIDALPDRLPHDLTVPIRVVLASVTLREPVTGDSR